MKVAAALLLSGLLVATCAASAVEVQSLQGTYSLRVTSLKQARFRQTIRQKYDFSCGSAAVATLLTYQYGYPVDEQAAFVQMYAHGDRQKIAREGFSLLDIKRYLHSQGFDADGFQLPLEKLQQENLPAIVLIDLKGYHHFVVIKGVRDGRVLVGDPALGTHSFPLNRFDQLWKNKLVFVIHNRRGWAVFNGAADWRAAPFAPLSHVIDRSGLGNMTLPKRGPGDF